MPTKAEINSAYEARKAFFKDPVVFALNAILIPGFTNMVARQHGGLTKFALVRSDAYEGKRFHGEPIPVYIISDGTDYGKGAFDGYWCPYENNAVKSTTVWKKGDALFTDRMDGCTFGIGSASKDGAVMVAHVNQQQFEVEKGNTLKMETMQRFGAHQAVGGGATLFEPRDYRRKIGEQRKMSSTTFGVRSSKKNIWSFYAQIMEGMGAEYILRTVKKIK